MPPALAARCRSSTTRRSSASGLGTASQARRLGGMSGWRRRSAWWSCTGCTRSWNPSCCVARWRTWRAACPPRRVPTCTRVRCLPVAPLRRSLSCAGARTGAAPPCSPVLHSFCTSLMQLHLGELAGLAEGGPGLVPSCPQAVAAAACMDGAPPRSAALHSCSTCLQAAPPGWAGQHLGGRPLPCPVLPAGCRPSVSLHEETQR